MANTMTIANKNIVNDFSTSSSLKVPAIIPTNKSNMASILKTLPGYFERLTIQLPAATAATKKGNAKKTKKAAHYTYIYQPLPCCIHRGSFIKLLICCRSLLRIQE